MGKCGIRSSWRVHRPRGRPARPRRCRPYVRAGSAESTTAGRYVEQPTWPGVSAYQLLPHLSPRISGAESEAPATLWGLRATEPLEVTARRERSFTCGVFGLFSRLRCVAPAV